MAESAALLPMLEQALALGEGWVTFDGRLIRTRAGIAAAAARRWGEAEQHYVAALEAAGRLANRIEQADIRRFQARMLLDRDQPGDIGQARHLVTQAVENYRQLRMPTHELIARAMLDRIG
jgi:hypothetical protein